MNPESRRIAGQLRHAFAGKPWHGLPLSDLLTEATPGQASARTIASAHSIWELVLHIELRTRVAFEATQGTPMPRPYGTEKDWPTAANAGADTWAETKAHLFHTAENLALAIDGFDDERLQETVPGREYDFYYLFHGVIQHSLYHAGQIALLSRATRSPGA
jgi:uncharacterized damage-inducible protein DinB